MNMEEETIHDYLCATGRDVPVLFHINFSHGSFHMTTAENSTDLSAWMFGNTLYSASSLWCNNHIVNDRIACVCDY